MLSCGKLEPNRPTRAVRPGSVRLLEMEGDGSFVFNEGGVLGAAAREAEQQASYVLADRDLHRVSLLSAAPPVERPGQRRAVEMRRLYGEDAARIQGMETAVQLAFDRNCDRKQPKYWPVIPLRL
ncbi:hypothetical protein COCON_G00198990 [Conger conger]|uniref:Uncharacterized protein n=1 Tax=Conger conger TaxID=82655 RepID=A0A9Q1D1V9_CONCO|nr:hypothetical protein COCON_G00198990 [Conger conger]